MIDSNDIPILCNSGSWGKIGDGNQFKYCIGTKGTDVIRKDADYKLFIQKYDKTVNIEPGTPQDDESIPGDCKYTMLCPEILNTVNCVTNSSDEHLPSIDINGKCDNSSTNDINKASLLPLIISNETFTNNLDNLFGDIGLISLNKVWGSSIGYKNNGVSSENIYYSKNEKVTNWMGVVKESQTVLALDVNGDNYKGEIKGVLPIDKKNGTCTKKPNTESGKRVGACIATKNNFGPGKYSCIAMVPKTSDKASGGRGYVFAMWTFHYEEIYPITKSKIKDEEGKTSTLEYKDWCFSNQYVGNIPNDKTSDIYQNFQASTCYECDEPRDCNGSVQTNINKCLDNLSTSNFCKKPTEEDSKKKIWWECYSARNDEIDIEIPANSPQFSDSWDDNLGWNTMNCNTWLGDNGDYDKFTNYYEQAQVNNLLSSFISENGEYHKYTIDWKVYEDDNNTVEFFFDDQFVYKTKKFVPTRAGKLIIGGWFGWWGSNRKKANFDSVTIKISDISIEPYKPYIKDPTNPNDQNFIPDPNDNTKPCVPKLEKICEMRPRIISDECKYTDPTNCPQLVLVDPDCVDQYEINCIPQEKFKVLDVSQTYDQYNIKGEKISCDFEEDYILKIVTVKDKSNLWIIIILCVILIIIWSLFLYYCFKKEKQRSPDQTRL